MSKEIEFSRWENSAIDEGDINPFVYRHQGLLLSEFVEFGGGGIKKSLHLFAGEISQLTHEKSTGYDLNNFKKFEKDVVEFLNKIELGGLCKSNSGDIRTNFARDFLEDIGLYKPMPAITALALMLSVVAGRLTLDQYFVMAEKPDYLKMIVEARFHVLSNKIITPPKLSQAVKS